MAIRLLSIFFLVSNVHFSSSARGVEVYRMTTDVPLESGGPSHFDALPLWKAVKQVQEEMRKKEHTIMQFKQSQIPEVVKAGIEMEAQRSHQCQQINDLHSQTFDLIDKHCHVIDVQELCSTKGDSIKQLYSQNVAEYQSHLNTMLALQNRPEPQRLKGGEEIDLLLKNLKVARVNWIKAVNKMYAENEACSDAVSKNILNKPACLDTYRQSINKMANDLVNYCTSDAISKFVVEYQVWDENQGFSFYMHEIKKTHQRNRLKEDEAGMALLDADANIKTLENRGLGAPQEERAPTSQQGTDKGA